MTNPRQRTSNSAANSSAARLPGLPVARSGNPSVDQFLEAVREYIEVREGARGQSLEKVVTERRLQELGVVGPSGSAQSIGTSTDGMVLQVIKANGAVTTLTVDQFATSIRDTQLFKDLLSPIGSLSRYDAYGPIIDRLKSEAEGAFAEVASLKVAFATSDMAVAAKVTQVTARLNDVGGVTVEEALTATADKVTGLRGQYTVKIQAGKKAIAGFGLAASEDPNGAVDSAFIVAANKFAIVTPDYNGDMVNPALSNIPFGVNSDGSVYINGSLRIGASTVNDLTTLADNANVPAINYVGEALSHPVIGNLKKNSVYRNTTDGNSYILDGSPLAWGLYLAAGAKAYFHVKYSTDGGATIAASASTPGVTHIGTYTDFVQADSTNPGMYAWTQVKGELGLTGQRGISNVTAASSASSPGGTTDQERASALQSQPSKVGDSVTLHNASAKWSKTWVCTVGGSPGSWGTVSLFVDGNAVITGTLAAGAIGAGTIDAANIRTTGDITTSAGMKADGIKTANNYASLGAAFIANDSSAAAIGVIGLTRSSNGAGVAGYSHSYTGYGGYFSGVGGTSLGRGIHCDAQMKVGGAAQFDSSVNITGALTAGSLAATTLGGKSASDFALASHTHTGYATTTSSADIGGAFTGTATGSFLANKPGGNTSNVWVRVVISGTVYYIPAWT